MDCGLWWLASGHNHSRGSTCCCPPEGLDSTSRAARPDFDFPSSESVSRKFVSWNWFDFYISWCWWVIVMYGIRQEEIFFFFFCSYSWCNFCAHRRALGAHLSHWEAPKKLTPTALYPVIAPTRFPLPIHNRVWSYIQPLSNMRNGIDTGQLRNYSTYYTPSSSTI